jgi:hypothetical protein
VRRHGGVRLRRGQFREGGRGVAVGASQASRRSARHHEQSLGHGLVSTLYNFFFLRHQRIGKIR